MRELKNIWWHLFSFALILGKWRWRGWKLFEMSWWRGNGEYIIQDSFTKHFMKFIGCRIRGHKKVQFIDDNGDDCFHCFNCGQNLDTFLDEIDVDAGNLEEVAKLKKKWSPPLSQQTDTLIEEWMYPASSS